MLAGHLDLISAKNCFLSPPKTRNALLKCRAAPISANQYSVRWILNEPFVSRRRCAVVSSVIKNALRSSAVGGRCEEKGALDEDGGVSCVPVEVDCAIFDDDASL